MGPALRHWQLYAAAELKIHVCKHTLVHTHTHTHTQAHACISVSIAPYLLFTTFNVSKVTIAPMVSRTL